MAVEVPHTASIGGPGMGDSQLQCRSLPTPVRLYKISVSPIAGEDLVAERGGIRSFAVGGHSVANSYVWCANTVMPGN